ncbi:prenyltransferase [Halomicroarcula sp. GCM10025709]|uniref:prenyltransferase n=1 Tax=Haloarcula TaxID=2237 RepID=UPI0024C3438D|nr:prenyltransferase [Halomicroarcula sp. YJ-61-S]
MDDGTAVTLPVTGVTRTAIDRAPRLWTLWKAARPSQLALIGAVYALGIGMALGRRGDWSLAAHGPAVGIGGLAVFAVAASIHYANEYVDVETDRRTERTPFSGGSGALAQTGVDRVVLARASLTAVIVGIAIAAGGYVTGQLSATAVVFLGVIALAGLGYSLPPTAFIRRGVGELVNALLGGLLLPLYGTTTVGTPTVADGVALVPFCCLIGCNLLATHWPDRDADASVGKRTLAVRLPPDRLRRLYWLLAGSAVVVTGLSYETVLPPLVVAGQAGSLPLVLWGGIVLTRQRSPFPAVAAMVWYALATAAAWWSLAVPFV